LRARHQQLVFLALLLIAVAWGGFAIAHNWLAAAVFGALCIVFGHSFFLAVEFLILQWVNRLDPTPRASPVALFRAWACETVVDLIVFCWRQPFRSNAEPDYLPTDAGRCSGVLLVHGFLCNRGVWNPWMRRLRERQIPFLAVNLEPSFASIDTYSLILSAALQRLYRLTGQPPLIVAHSMGGLAVRAYLRSRCGAECRPGINGNLLVPIHSVITIATPHGGTWLGRFGCGTNAREMRLNGAWIAGLARTEREEDAVRFTCFYSQCDNVVFPASAGTLPGADNRHLPGVAHLQMVYRPEVFEEVLSRLRPVGESGVARASH
jgi:triacylglycerol lipase